ncbi:hypothetical protein QNN00_18095 [Bacillus velezensis]|nr:hypothetical protein [Bacillus velezensis]
MDGKITDIAKQLNEFSKFINSNMESIGKSISNNLIDKLKEASDALNTVTKGNKTGKRYLLLHRVDTQEQDSAQVSSPSYTIQKSSSYKTDTANILDTVKAVRENNTPSEEAPKWGQGGKLATLINKGITTIPSIIPNINQSSLSNSLVPSIQNLSSPPDALSQ